MDRGELLDSIADFSEAIRLDSSDPRPLAGRAVALAFLGNDAAAERDIESAEALGFDRSVIDAAIDELSN